MSIQDDKTFLRRTLTEKRGSIPRHERLLLDERFTARLLSLPQYKCADTILCYVSSRSEPETRPIIADALASGKKVACPRCTDDCGNMIFCYIDTLSQLVPGRFGLLEPDPAVCHAFDPDSIRPASDRSADIYCGSAAVSDEYTCNYGHADVLCVVPGLSFDLSGGRLGYGKGYYDRFLDRFHGVSAGICYERMLCEKLPLGEYDRRTDIVVTEERIIFCKNDLL